MKFENETFLKKTQLKIHETINVTRLNSLAIIMSQYNAWLNQMIMLHLHIINTFSQTQFIKLNLLNLIFQAWFTKSDFLNFIHWIWFSEFNFIKFYYVLKYIELDFKTQLYVWFSLYVIIKIEHFFNMFFFFVQCLVYYENL